MNKPLFFYLGIVSLFVMFSCGQKNVETILIESEKIQPSMSVPEKITVTVTVDSLRVRVSPYLDSEIIGHLMTGNKVLIESRTLWSESIAGLEAPWFFVRADGYSGWTYGGFLDFGEFSAQQVAGDPGIAPPEDIVFPTDDLDFHSLPELLLPVFGMENELLVKDFTEGVISYDAVHEKLVIPFTESPDSELKAFSIGNSDVVLHIVAESSGSARYEQYYQADGFNLLSSTTSIYSSDAILVDFFRLAVLDAGSWEIYVFIGDNNWPAAVGKIDIIPFELSLVPVEEPNPLKDSSRSRYYPGDTVYAFGKFHSGSENFQLALYHVSDEYREGQILLRPAAALQINADSTGFWKAEFVLDELMSRGRYWAAIGSPIEDVENLQLFISSVDF